MRRFSIIVTALATAVAATILATPGDANARYCPGVATFALGGNGDPHSAYVPGVGGHVIRIHYPADVFSGDRSRDIARDNLNGAARKMRAECPGTHIKVVGYSLGASAGSITVDRWQNDSVMSRNSSAVFYGNPRRPVANGWGGIEAAGLPNIPFVYSWHGARRNGPIPVVDVCNEARDIICSAPIPLHRDLLGAWNALDGYLSGDHLY